MSLEPLLLDELKPHMCGVLLDLLDWVYHVLVSRSAYVARHVFWHALSPILGDIQVIT
jgi:hypothetical protein